MKFNVESSALLKELQKLSGVLSTNNTLPILDNFLFDVKNGEISIFETEYYNELKTFKANDNGVSSLLFCEKRKLLASGGNDARIRIYNLNGEQLKSIPAHHYTIYSLLAMNDDVSISASRDRSIKVWKGFYEKVIQKIDHKSQGHNFSVNTLLKINEHSFSSGGDDTKIIVFKEN